MKPDLPHTAGLLPGYSLEMTAKDLPALEAASSAIPAKSVISVTFLQNEHAEERVTAARRIHDLGFIPCPHIAARRVSSQHEVSDFLAKVTGEGGVKQVFVIAGDATTPLGPYADSLQLIRSGLFQDNAIQTVGIAGYPEGHPDIPEAVLWRSLIEKATALRESGLACEIVTQFGFDPAPVLAWLVRLRQEGVDAPVRIGMPGPAKITTLLRFAARCGVGASARVLSKYGISMTRLIGSAGPDQLLDSVSSQYARGLHGDVRIHLYPFGGLQRAVEWAAAYTARPEATMQLTSQS